MCLRYLLLLRRNVKRFRGGLVFKAHRLLHHSTRGLRVRKKKKVPLARGSRARSARPCAPAVRTSAFSVHAIHNILYSILHAVDPKRIRCTCAPAVRTSAFSVSQFRLAVQASACNPGTLDSFRSSGSAVQASALCSCGPHLSLQRFGSTACKIDFFFALDKKGGVVMRFFLHWMKKEGL